MSAAGFDYKLKGIASVISSTFLTVPVNQRSYSWTEKEVKDFLNDLSKGVASSEPFYYLGPIVLREVQPDMAMQVVDGQQRLVTAILALIAIRNLIPDNPADTRQKFTTQYLQKETVWSSDVTPRITLNHLDHDFFLQTILPDPSGQAVTKLPVSKRSHKRLLQAYEILHAYFANIPESSRQIELQKWDKYLADCAQVLMCSFSETTNPYTLFETLNARGLQPTTAELVKNYLFGLSEDRLDACMNKWAEMVGTLEAVDAPSTDDVMDQFLRHFWVAKTGKVTRTAGIFRDIRSMVQSKSQAIAFANELSVSSKLYHILISPTAENWQPYDSDSKSSMEAINIMGMTQIRPLVMVVLAKFKKSDVRQSVQLLVNAAVRLLVSGAAGTGNIESGFAGVVSKINAGVVVNHATLRDALRLFVPKDADFEQAFSTYTMSKTPLIRYVLRVLEVQNSGSSNPAFVVNPSKDAVNTEHVLPLRPTAGEWSQFSPSEFKNSVKKVGNLALMQAKPNAQIGNGAFSAKKAALAKEPFALTSEIATKNQWDVSEIIARQTRLAALAVKAWPV
jgi:hypothetical protein